MEEKKISQDKEGDMVSKMGEREHRIRGLDGYKIEGQGEITNTKVI